MDTDPRGGPPPRRAAQGGPLRRRHARLLAPLRLAIRVPVRGVRGGSARILLRFRSRLRPKGWSPPIGFKELP